MENIVIIGGGGHAKVLLSTLKKNNDYSVLGYTDHKDCGELLGVKYLGNDTNLESLFKKNICKYAALGIGYTSPNTTRLTIINNLVKVGFEFPPIISKSSIINEDVTIGEGTVVFDGVVINCGSLIGRYSIINTSAVIEHDCKIGDFTHIAPGTVLCGGVNIGNNSMIGAGTTIIPYREIGENCMIGAGSVVVKNIIKRGVYFGVPAKSAE